MSDATSEQDPSEELQRKRASTLSIKLAGVIAAMTLAPLAALTWLAVLALRVDLPFVFGWIFLFGWTLALANVASARCRNVVARWLLLGPGDFKTRATFGAIILAGDWLLTALLIRTLAPDGPLRFYVTVAWMTGMSSVLPFLWWLIVRGRGGRDVVPGVNFFTRTFTTRDLLIGLFLAGLALAAGRAAFAYAAPAGGAFYLSTDLAPQLLEPALFSIGFWMIDAGLRLFVLGKRASDRGCAVLAGLLLVFSVIAVTLAAENGPVLPAFLVAYAVAGIVHEATLRQFGVRAVNLRSESA